MLGYMWFVQKRTNQEAEVLLPGQPSYVGNIKYAPVYPTDANGEDNVVLFDISQQSLYTITYVPL
jgi:hypothetical protein